MKKIQLLKIQFPEINLKTRDAHKLRGYFGQMFKEHSALLHNHYDSGELRYRYPLVQYKVLGGVPTLVALEEATELLTDLFLKIKTLEIGGRRFDVHHKSMKSEQMQIGYSAELYRYRFSTLWMALNQDNYKKYLQSDAESKPKMLNKIIIGNVLSFFKGVKWHLDEASRLHAKVDIFEKNTQFKEREMVAFEGSFYINACLPDGIGLGKAVSRGFGTIEKI